MENHGKRIMTKTKNILFFSFLLVVKSQSLQNNLYFSLTADVNVEVFFWIEKTL
jgi:hypothetical protein